MEQRSSGGRQETVVKRRRPHTDLGEGSCVLDLSVPTEQPADRLDIGAEPGGRIRPLMLPFAALHDLTRLQVRSPSIFGYLMKEHGLLRAFGERTGLLVSSLLPPRPKLLSRLRNVVDEHYVVRAHELIRVCGAVLEESWRYLGRYEYNLLVVVHRLIDKLRSLRVQGADLRDRNVVERLQAVQSLFVFLRSRDEYLDAIEVALDQVAEREGGPAGAAHQLASYVRMVLLGEGASGPTLGEVLVAANMNQQRRFLTIDDLQTEQFSDLVFRGGYAVSDEIRERVDEAIEAARDRLAALTEAQARIDEGRARVPFEGADIDFSLLRQFYSERNSGQELALDGDLMTSVPAFVAAYDTQFHQLFSKRVGLSDGRSIRLPVDDSVPATLSRIHSIRQRGFDQKKAVERLPRERYFELSRNKEKPSAPELLVRDAIDEMRDLYIFVGGKVELLRTSATLQRELLSGETPVQELAIQSSNSLDGLVVDRALEIGALLCYQIAAFWFHPDYYDLPNRDAEVKRQTQQQLSLLGRLGAPTSPRPSGAAAASGDEDGPDEGEAADAGNAASEATPAGADT